MAAYSPEYIEELRSNFWEAKKWYKDTLESVDYWEAGGYINGDSSLFDYTTTFLTSYIEAVEGPADGSEDLDAIECYYHKKTNQNTDWLPEGPVVDLTKFESDPAFNLIYGLEAALRLIHGDHGRHWKRTGCDYLNKQVCDEARKHIRQALLDYLDSKSKALP